MNFIIFKRLLVLLCLSMSLGLAGCGSDSTTAGNVSNASALPQPTVDCGGSSCVD